MPVEVKGLVELRKALHTYAPDLENEMNKTWMQNLNSLTTKAKGFIPSSMPRDLHNWERVATAPAYGRQRAFPAFNSSEAKRGIKYGYKASKPNDSGFRSLARVANLTAVGAIYETAGRRFPKGQPIAENRGKSRTNNKFSSSNNPNAGEHFIAILQQISPLTEIHQSGKSSTSSRKFKGRAIFRAVAEDRGKTATALIKATELANQKFVARVNMGTRRAA